MKIGDSAGGRLKSARVLRVDSAFDGGAKKSNVVLGDGERRAGRNLDLLVDNVDAGDHLRDRMLDLHPRVHLDEEELPVLIEELDRASPDIAQFSHRLGDNPADALALLGVEGRGGALLPDFLVAALKRAVALAKMNGVALRVAEHLNLDVARLGEIFLEIDGIAAERGPRFDPGGADRLGNVVGPPGDLHAAAPSARRSLDDHRIADRGCDLARFGFVPDAALGARDAGDPETLSGALGFDLVAHHADVLGLRADEHDVVLLQDFRETRVLGQKAVAWMNGVGAGDLARRDNAREC